MTTGLLAATQFDLNPDQCAVQERARDLAEGFVAERAAETDRTEMYPWDVVEQLKKHGFTGMTVPKAYGGPGHCFLNASIAIEQFARVCGVTGRIAVEANMGGISAVMRYGTEAQKHFAASFVLDGDKPAICITEPDAGSAASEMTTRADKRGDKYILNGKKHWITGGGVSRLHLIFARVFDEAGEEQGIGGFLAVRGEDEGLVIGAREPTMGLRGIPETEVFFNDLELGEDRVVMPPGGFRRGFAELMDAYNSQRVGAATVAMGVAAGAYDLALDFVQKREQFGRPIAEFQGLQWMLSDMSMQLDAARLMIWRAAASAAPFPDVQMAAHAKIFASEMAIKVSNDALQLFGARGYSRNLPVERMVRDARMFTIGGGTAQILRTVAASRILGQKLPQTRDGYARASQTTKAVAAE